MADSILRSVDTHFWDDPYVADKLDPSEKLLFLYFLTNPLTNLLGIYEISLKRISVDTGFDRDMVLKIIRRFSEDGKIYYYENYIILPNRSKHQNLNSNMEKNVKKLFINLPDKIKEFIIDRDLKAFESLLKPFKGFERLSNRVSTSTSISNNNYNNIYNNIQEKKEKEKKEKNDFLNLSKYVDSNNLTEDEKRQRINAIAIELKQSTIWLNDVSRITRTSGAETWNLVKTFLDELKAKDDYFKSISAIKGHFINWYRKYKPALA